MKSNRPGPHEAREDESVVEIVLGSAARRSGTVLLSEGGTGPSHGGAPREATYGATVKASRELAMGLLTLGLAPGDRVAVLVENRIELVITEWACLLSGLVWVACNVRMTAEELQALVDDCAPAALISSSRMAGIVAGLRLGSPCVEVIADVEHPSWVEAVERGRKALETGGVLSAPARDDPVRIRYTSGTAGRPKGAVLARRAYDASVKAVGDVIGPLSRSDVLLQIAPMTHASGAMLVPHVAVGARAVVLDGFDVEQMLDVIEKDRVTAVFVVPTMLVRFLDAIDDPDRVATLRTIVYGGAPMPPAQIERGLALLGPRFVQIYGLTESTWPVCALTREDHARRPGESAADWRARLRSCGRPTAVGELRILDPRGEPVRVGEPGEICVKGRNTMDGYWQGQGHGRSPDRKGLDVAGWMRTGDIGVRDEAGYVTIIDRLYDMIITGGFNVYPREVEDALSSHPAVLEAAVVGLPDAEWGETVHAAVVLRPGATADASELTRHCASQLAGYKKPKSVEIVPALPKNASGKVVRREVRTRRIGR